MSEQKFKLIWCEFKESVYVGEDGYVSALKIDPDSSVAPNVSLAVAHWQESGMWFFALLDGKCVAVPMSNIRYVYGQTMGENPTALLCPPDIVAEDMPKRRGRPPKVKE